MIHLNVIPESSLLGQARRRHIVRWTIAAAAAIATVAVPLGLDWLRRSEAAALQTRTDQQYVLLEQVRSELRSLTMEAADLMLQTQRADSLRSKRPWSGLLARIGSCMPDGCWLSSLATDPPVPPDVAPSTGTSSRKGPVGGGDRTIAIDAPRRLKISGYATDPAYPHVFVVNLKEAQLFTQVRLERSARDVSGDARNFQFELACEW